MGDFSGKVAIVTGTTGIGRAIACGIEASGNDSLSKDAARLGLGLQVELCDVTNPDQVKAVIAKAVGNFGGLDIIANAAAIHPFGNVVETDLATWNRCMMVNVGSIYLLAHFGVPELKKRGGGSIINLASVQGTACQRGVVAYAASKGAILSFTRALALDHAPDQIRVNSISPGSIETPMLARSASHFSPDLPMYEVFKRFGASHPLGRIGKPEEVAELAAFLASDKAGFCTGGDYLVDGGLLAGIAVQ